MQRYSIVSVEFFRIARCNSISVLSIALINHFLCIPRRFLLSDIRQRRKLWSNAAFSSSLSHTHSESSKSLTIHHWRLTVVILHAHRLFSAIYLMAIDLVQLNTGASGFRVANSHGSSILITRIIVKPVFSD